jgi:hypothetical protein
MPEHASGRIYNERFTIVPGTARVEEMLFFFGVPSLVGFFSAPDGYPDNSVARSFFWNN